MICSSVNGLRRMARGPPAGSLADSDHFSGSRSSRYTPKDPLFRSTDRLTELHDCRDHRTSWPYFPEALCLLARRAGKPDPERPAVNG